MVTRSPVTVGSNAVIASVTQVGLDAALRLDQATKSEDVLVAGSANLTHSPLVAEKSPETPLLP